MSAALLTIRKSAPGSLRMVASQPAKLKLQTSAAAPIHMRAVGLQGPPGVSGVAVRIITSGVAAQLTKTDNLILLASPDHITAVALPADAVQGQIVTIKDALGAAGAHPVAITGGAIDGAPLVSLSSPFEALTLACISQHMWSLI